MLSTIKIKENLIALSIFIAIWYGVLYFANSEAYSNIALIVATIWVAADGLCNHFKSRGIAQFGLGNINIDLNEDCRNKKSISNYFIEMLILLYIFVEYFYSNTNAEHLVFTVFAYSLLQRLFDFGFASLSSKKFEKLRLEEELDKEAGLVLAMLLHQLIGYYKFTEDFIVSSADSSLLIISFAMAFYSSIKVFLEAKNQNSKIVGQDESEDNGTLGISTASFCSRESQDKYTSVAEHKDGSLSYKAIAWLNLASIFKKMGLHERQLERLQKYKIIEKQLGLENADPEAVVKELYNIVNPQYVLQNKENLTTDEQYVGKVTKRDDVKRFIYNFESEFTECEINVENLNSKPIKGFFTILKILLIFLVILAILHSYKVIDIMRTESATAGSITLGALFFAFKDFSFSIFSGLRIYMDNLFSVGDKLRLDEFNIVGRVVSFNPATVEIRSSDNSVTKIYMHKIVASTFTNLAHRKKRGRYINLTLNIDANSIVSLNSDPKLREKLSTVFLLKRYLKCKEEDIENSKKNETRKEFRQSIKDEFYTDKQQFNDDCAYILNTRHITNIGTFREYVFRYLSNHNLLDNDQYIMARQLQPSDTGVVIEIKAYTEVQYSNKRDYERIYSDIVEHLIVALPEFKLTLFHGEASSGRKIEFS